MLSFLSMRRVEFEPAGMQVAEEARELIRSSILCIDAVTDWQDSLDRYLAWSNGRYVGCLMALPSRNQ